MKAAVYLLFISFSVFAETHISKSFVGTYYCFLTMDQNMQVVSSSESGDELCRVTSTNISLSGTVVTYDVEKVISTTNRYGDFSDVVYFKDNSMVWAIMFKKKDKYITVKALLDYGEGNMKLMNIFYVKISK